MYAMFKWIKIKELKTIDSLREELSELKKELNFITIENKTLHECNNKIKFENIELSKYKQINNIDKEVQRLNEQIEFLRKQYELSGIIGSVFIHKLAVEKQNLQKNIDLKKTELVELNNEILLQEYSMYSPIYDFANSEMYKDRLDFVRKEQKKMILLKTAAICNVNWHINGSYVQGRIMTNQNIKQILRCFNDECDMLINKVRFNNITAFIEKMKKSYKALNQMNSKNCVFISYEYFELKKQELQLAYEYAQKKQEEKEEQRRIREQIREEAKLMKEIEEARKDLDKEKRHYLNALLKIENQLLLCKESERYILIDKKKGIEKHLDDIEDRIEDVEYRSANKRAGYVYVISNIGSFGENVYKIGMTRRLEPMERIYELGGASVPFRFDVHAMIFSDDAPALETALHHAFKNKKVNMVNGRREFFKVTLEEVENVIKQNYDKTVNFIKIPQAEQYRESKKILERLNSLPTNNVTI